jgi:lyso-ornithine lipid O-acyltransferase
MSRMRAGLTLAGFLGLTLPLMPVQAALNRFDRDRARRFPHWYHQRVCRLLGIRLHIDGAIVSDRPALIIANHTSWLDIPVLSAVAPVSFVAKREVAAWPLVAQLARLQRTVFVDRERRTASAGSVGEIGMRLAQGDAIVLFAEGTSSDGNRVLPFRSSLLGAVLPGRRSGGQIPAATAVQTLAIVYTHLHGLPLGRGDRPGIGWYGDMEMTGHAWELLKAGPLDVHIRIGPPLPLDSFADRKALARHAEDAVRADVVAVLRDPDLGAGSASC